MKASLQILLVLLVTTLFSCEKEDKMIIPVGEVRMIEKLLTLPEGFTPPPKNDQNLFSLEKWALGKKLFYDPVMSRDLSVSCASCHQADHGFADGVALSKGVEERVGARNAPTLTNVAYLPHLMTEGGVPDLERQILVPIDEHVEFDFNIQGIAQRLNELPDYVELSRAAFDREPDAFVITRALAVFERTLISGNSRFDQYYFQGKETALGASAKRGYALFNSEQTNCSSCHSGFLFTSFEFENNGLYENYEDMGRKRLTTNPSDDALFKIPTLRNIALTAPYMHDGSKTNLKDVVEHYNAGGADHPNKSPLVRPLNLTDTEVSDLVHFLESLTDSSFIREPLFRP